MTEISCLEKTRLLEEYEAAIFAYSTKVSELKQRIGTSSKETYQSLYRSIEQLRDIGRRAQQALESHIDTHGC
jgi:hypothetical protein